MGEGRGERGEGRGERGCSVHSRPPYIVMYHDHMVCVVWEVAVLGFANIHVSCDQVL